MKHSQPSAAFSAAAGKCLLLVVLVTLTAARAWPAGPRWVTGSPYFYPPGYPVAWYTSQPQYFTDPGDLSSSVNHAAADALVASAAQVWNIPTSKLTLAQGGSLNEHISAANVTMGPSGPVFPADVQPSNGSNKQIAVIYDSDGSLTELLLGGGASSPGNCLHAGVTESVDSLVAGQGIHHALLILNGRCTGPAPEQQLQMQYQLMRAFGRVLGLGWSQTNDNVFTGTPQPTYNQALNWPIMHPIDIVCGPYSYQCLPQPFTLRPDDISSLDMLYNNSPGYTATGKQETSAQANSVEGQVVFPNGQGMQGVNVVVQRDEAFWDIPEPWQSVSGVSGYLYRRQGPTPARPADNSAEGSNGVYDAPREGYYRLQRIPIPNGQAWQNLVVSTEPVNPLYTGPYAVGPYTGSQVAESGSTPAQKIWIQSAYSNTEVDFTPSGAPVTCGASGDGTDAAPVAVPQGGWWNGFVCGYGHAAWSAITVKANRSLAIEVTALNEQGSATTAKLVPTIGVWNANDARGTLPTVAAAGTGLNGLETGLTTLRVPAASADRALRLSIADQRGDGRPDFSYQARVLYADSISPATVGSAGGVVTLSGYGFREGDVVLVNGGQATIQSVSASTIVARVPASLGLGAYTGFTADVTVRDPASGGISVMSGALTYAPGSPTIEQVSTPSGTVTLNLPATQAFAVKIVGTDGASPLAGRQVVFSATGGAVQWGACGTPACTVTTDAKGVASTTVEPTAAGAIVLKATASMGVITATLTAAAARLQLVSAPAGVVTAGTPAALAFAVQVFAADAVTPLAGASVTLVATGGGALWEACSQAVCTLTADANGMVRSRITPTAAGTVQLTASMTGADPVTASFNAVTEALQLRSSPQGIQTTDMAAVTAFAVLALGSDGSAVANEPVVISSIGGVVRFGACGAAICTLVTDANGLVQTTVTPLTAGSVTLVAMGSSGSISAPLVSAPPSLRLVSAPSGIVTTGRPAAVSVAVLAGDGVTPMAGAPLQFTVSGVPALLSACGGVQCAVAADGSGVAGLTVTPSGVGAMTLTVSGAAGTVVVHFVAAAAQMQVAASPVAQVAAGSSAGVAAVRLLGGDGFTPLPGEPVLFSVTSGSATLAACGTAVCTVVSDANGLASTGVEPTAPGSVQISAVAVSSIQRFQLTALANAAETGLSRSLAAVRPMLYLAAGATLQWQPAVTVTGAVADLAGAPVQWSGPATLGLSELTSAVAADGGAAVPASTGPLAAGAQVVGSACAWSTVCGSFAVVGVAPELLQPEPVSGATQSAAAGDTLGLVTLRVTDGQGHGVAGAEAQVYQTVSQWQQSCSGTGRCPAAPVYRSSISTVVSDIDGWITIDPAQLPGVASVTQVAVAVGSRGFCNLTLEKHP